MKKDDSWCKINQITEDLEDEIKINNEELKAELDKNKSEVEKKVDD